MKVCIVAQGGGMIASYHAGVIAGIKKKFGFNNIERIVASSGAAATYSYLVSGQDELINRGWLILLESKKFIRPLKFLSNHKIVDIDFMIDEVFKKIYPLDINFLKKSPIKFDIGVTDVQTGKSVFFSKNDISDFFELLRASCAIPYFYGKKIYLNKNYYYDGTIGDVSGLKQIKNEKNILLILTRPNRPLIKVFRLRKLLQWLLIRKENKNLQKSIWNSMFEYNKIPNIVKEFRKMNKNIVVIQPKKKLPVLRIDTRINRLKKTVKQGYDDFMNNKEVENLFLNKI